jgi:homocysteine S-methyltransferase
MSNVFEHPAHELSPPRPRAAQIARLLDPEQVILFDGAMGTMLYARGVFINQCYDELVLRSPDLVRDIHAAYVKAGADVLETNTFGANRLKLTQYGLEGQVAAINTKAAELARDAAGDQRLVAGAVGPLGVRLEPYGALGRDEARAIFAEQMSALKAGGADCFLLETFADLEELEQAILAARAVDADMPVIAQATVGLDLRTAYGASPEDIARVLDRWGVDVIGLNCSVGPQTILEAVERMAAVTQKKISAQPNAGMPRDVGGRSMYMASPEYMATYARHLVQAGAKIVGGCCGTTPDHIKAMAEGVRPLILRGDAIKNPAALSESLARFAGRGINVRILFRPAAEKTGSFFLVSAAPTVSTGLPTTSWRRRSWPPRPGCAAGSPSRPGRWRSMPNAVTPAPGPA